MVCNISVMLVKMLVICSCTVLLLFMRMRHFWRNCRLSRKLLVVLGLLINVSWHRMVVMSGNLEMVFYVNWLVIHFVLSFLITLLPVFMLCYLSYTLALWLDILVVRSC